MSTEDAMTDYLMIDPEYELRYRVARITDDRRRSRRAGRDAPGARRATGRDVTTRWWRRLGHPVAAQPTAVASHRPAVSGRA